MNAAQAVGIRRALTLGLLASLALWLLFSRGFYRETQYVIAFWQASAALGAALTLGRMEGRPLRRTAGRLAAVGLWSAYVLSAALVAVSPREAVTEVIKNGIYLAVFLAASELTESCHGRGPEAREGSWWRRSAGPGTLPLAFWGAAALMALASLLAATGLLPFDVAPSQRLDGFMGYPNSTGALVGAAFLIGLGLGKGEVSARPGAGRLGGAVLAAGQWSLLTMLFLTMSRGAWLVFPLAVGVVVLVWPAGRRLGLIAEVALIGLSAVVMAPFLAKAFRQPAIGGPLLAAGLVLALAGGWVARRFRTVSGRRQALVAIGAVGLGVTLVAALLFSGALPGTLTARLTGFSLSERGVLDRLAWMRDGLSIVRDYPVLGAGGGGWAALYFQYQRYPYYSAEVHNDFVETWVETGTVGFAALLGLVAASAYAVWFLKKRYASGSSERRGVVAGLAGGAAMLLFHSLLDLDFALVGVGVFLWIILGVIDGLYLAETPPGMPVTLTTRSRRERRHGSPARPSPSVWPTISILGVAIAVGLVGASLVAAAAVGRRAISLGEGGRVAESLAAFRQASALDPLSPGFHLGQAYALEALARSGAPDQMEAAWREAQRAVALAPQDPNFHVLYGFFALRNATFDVAVSECERTVELQPFEVSRYCSLGEAYFAAGQYMLHEGRPEAREYLLKAVGVAGRLAAQAEKGEPRSWSMPASVPLVALWSGKAQAFLGDYPEAARLLGEAHDSPLCAPARETGESVARRKAEAAFWLSLVQEKLGDAEAARGYFEEARAGNPAADALIQELRAWLGRAGGGGP